jgi:hypothetical protein
MTKKRCVTGSLVDQHKKLHEDNVRLRAWQEKYAKVRNALIGKVSAADKASAAADVRAQKAERMAAMWRLYAKRLETHVKGPLISTERAFVKGNADAAPDASHEAWMGKMR